MVDMRIVLAELELAARAAGEHPRRSPATDDTVRLKEQELGVHLPSSYRTFLSVSDGWGWLGRPSTAPGALLSVLEVQPLAVADPELLGISSATFGCELEEHMTYGAHQDTAVFDNRLLARALAISSYTEGGIVLLVPGVPAAEEGWEAWHMAHWLPGATRWQSFSEMLAELAREAQRAASRR